MPGCQPRSPQGAQCVELRLKPQLVANQSHHLIRTRRTRPRPDASGRRTALFGAWLEPRPRGLGVSSCGRSRSSKPQLEVSLRRRSVPTSSCLRLVEGGTDRRGGRAACLASSLRPHCSPRDLLPRWPAPFDAFKNRRDGVPWRGVPWRAPHRFFRVQPEKTK